MFVSMLSPPSFRFNKKMRQKGAHKNTRTFHIEQKLVFVSGSSIVKYKSINHEKHEKTRKKHKELMKYGKMPRTEHLFSCFFVSFVVECSFVN